MIKSEQKSKIVKDLSKNEKNTGDPAAQVGILTARIQELTEHLKINKKDHMARRGLLQMVGKRRRLLAYMNKKDPERYRTAIARLGLRK